MISQINKSHIVVLSAHLYNYFFQESAKEFGGVSRIYRVVRRLAKYPDNRISCIVGDYGQLKQISSQGIALIKCPVDKPFRFIEIYLSIIRQHPDIVLEFYASARTFILGILKLIHRLPFIYFVGHDMDVDGRYAKLTNPLFYRLYVWGLKMADKIICQTPEQANKLKQNYGLDSVVILSPYVKIKPPLKHNKDFILWVGRSAYYKRPEFFLELAKLIPNENFLMISNPSEHDRGIHQQILEIGSVLKNIEIIESIPFHQIQKYYGKAKLLINTSDFEGFPNTFIEAALEKTPTISLNVNPNQMLTRHACGFYCKGNFKELVCSCRELGVNIRKREEMGNRSRAYAISHHNIDLAIKKIKTVIHEVL